METQKQILLHIETEYDKVNNKMIQHFGDDAVRIEFDKITGRVSVFVGGELADAYENLTIDEFENVQRKYADVWFELTNKSNSKN